MENNNNKNKLPDTTLNNGTDNSTDSTSVNIRKRPIPIVIARSTRPQRSSKCIKKAYSPPPSSAPSSQSSVKRGGTKPPTKINKVLQQSTNNVSSNKVTTNQQQQSKNINNNNKEGGKRNLNTVNGQISLIRRANRDRKFSRILINSLDQHVDKILDTVRVRGRKGKNKVTRSMQIQEMRNNKKIDLNTPESILTTINLSTIINRKNFDRLPSYYQYRLTQLLPKCDQIMLPNDIVSPSDTALNNEFFSRALASYSYRLCEGRLTNESLYRLRRELDREKKNLDPLKVKYFEPFFKEPEELIDKEKEGNLRHKNGMAFLNTMVNCIEVCRNICSRKDFSHNNSTKHGTQNLSKEISNKPVVHFNDQIATSHDGQNKQNDSLIDSKSKQVTAATATTTTTTKVSVKSSNFPMLVMSREKKSDQSVEILDYFEQVQFDEIIKVMENKNEVNQTNKTTTKLVDDKQTNICISETNSTNIGNGLKSSHQESSQQLSVSVCNNLPKKDDCIEQKSGQTLVTSKPQSLSIDVATSPSLKLSEFLAKLQKEVHPINSQLNINTFKNSREWEKFFQSIYLINCLLKKFIHCLFNHYYMAEYKKLKLAMELLLVPLDYVCKSCSLFIESYRNLSIQIDIPKLNSKMKPIIPNELLSSFEHIELTINNQMVLNQFSNGSHETKLYFENLNDGIMEQMLVYADELICGDFDSVAKQIIYCSEPVSVETLFDYLRRMKMFIKIVRGLHLSWDIPDCYS
ncbi:putative Polycomb group protein asxl2 [Blomia tropicalis]|nr:putative Polycomb group protein asxl2 [Blomia tropicalis]